MTGVTGSGKTTTLAAMIDCINENDAVHILTIEDPVEYVHRHKSSLVNQREIGADTRASPRALRLALRQDPDVILIGEMRDLETIGRRSPPPRPATCLRHPAHQLRRRPSTASSTCSRRASRRRSAPSFPWCWRA